MYRGILFCCLVAIYVAVTDAAAKMAMKSSDLLHVKSNATSRQIPWLGDIGGRNTEKGKGFTNEALCGMPVVKEASDTLTRNGEAVKGKWPWQAMIVRFSEKLGYYYFLCAGTLIQKRWLITAAHCFNGEPISHTLVILVDRHNEETGKSTKMFATGAVLCNPDYNKKNNKNDICLVKLAVEVEYSSYIMPACLPEPGEKAIMGDTCEVTGWDDTKANAVRETEVSIMAKEQCLQLPRKNDTHIESTHFCAKYPEGSKTCHGESGGPLSCERIKGGRSHYVLYGIKSVDDECGAKEKPGVFTEVESFVQWTDETIANAPDTDKCFAESSIHDCDSLITTSGTIVRSPVTDMESWLYPHDIDCSWNVLAPEGYKIGLEFLCFFHVEKVPGSLTECNDYMTIASQKAGIDILYCGNDLLDPLVINSNEVTIGFHSNVYQSGAGFVIRTTFIGAKKTSSKRSSGDRPPPRRYYGGREHEKKIQPHPKRDDIWKDQLRWQHMVSAARQQSSNIPLSCCVSLIALLLAR